MMLSKTAISPEDPSAFGLESSLVIQPQILRLNPSSRISLDINQTQRQAQARMYTRAKRTARTKRTRARRKKMETESPENYQAKTGWVKSTSSLRFLSTSDYPHWSTYRLQRQLQLRLQQAALIPLS